MQEKSTITASDAAAYFPAVKRTWWTGATSCQNGGTRVQFEL